jgi:hypothetical protein
MNKLFFTLFLLFQNSLTFAATEDGRWHAGIGDPTVFGWITVLAYLVAVARCFVKARDSKKFGGNYQFWLYLAVFLLLLGIDKQLDLPSWFTEVLRDSAQTHGWYEHRKPVQIAFITLVGLGMMIALLSLRHFLANSWRRYKFTWLGIILLCTFILIRAASYHRVDKLINRDILGLKINEILEIGAILLIIFGTYFNKKIANPLNTNTFPLTGYAEIANEGDDLQCPQCGVQPLANTVDGRLFKCRSCGCKFRVRVLNS